MVVGFDGEFSYAKLLRAVSHLRYTPGCIFVATNTDLTYPDTHVLLPGGGTLVAAVAAGAGRAPDVVAGKPNTSLLGIIGTLAGPSFSPARTCMVGDRLDTDIAFGNDGGLGSSLLVLTGVSTAAEVDSLPAGDRLRPTHIIDSLGDLCSVLDADE